jgi:hypothetical protein
MDDMMPCAIWLRVIPILVRQDDIGNINGRIQVL